MKSLKLEFKTLLKRLDFFSKKFVDSGFSGEHKSLYRHEHKSLYRHKGIEFEDYKNFVSGDDATLIDWKASLRGGKLLIRQYTQMKNLNVFILVDVSNSMLYSSIDKIKCEYAAELAASLSYYFLKSGEGVSIILFSDKVVKYIPPLIGLKQYHLIIKVLSNPNFYGGKFNLSKVVSYVDNFIRGEAIVIIISDFIGLGEKWEKSISILSRKAEVVGMIVRDPHDNKIKEKIGQAAISDPFSDKLLLVDLQEIKSDYEFTARKRLERIKEIFAKYRSETLELETDKSFVDPIVKFFSERRTRWQ